MTSCRSPLRAGPPRVIGFRSTTAEGLSLITSDGATTRQLSKGEWLAHRWSVDAMTRDLGPAMFVPWGLSINPVPLRGLSVGPGGKTLATSINRTQGDLWLLEGFNRQ